MSFFRVEHVQLVERALNAGSREGMTGRQVWDAVDRDVPEHSVHLILSQMVHEGLVERESTHRGFRRKGISVFRAL